MTLESGSEITPTWPGLQSVLYESRFHAQFFSVYQLRHGEKGVGSPSCGDSPVITGSRVGCGDAFPDHIKISDAGTYLIRLHVRHPTVTLLEGLSDMPLVLERNLSKPVNVSFYCKKSDCLIGGSQGKLTSAKLAKGKDISF